MIRQSSYSKLDLLAHAWGRLGQVPGDARLPAPPFLMFDRITRIDETGGEHGRGSIAAEKDVAYDEWFFICHFRDDPVMPGCLGLDALWQLAGFFLSWSGCPGQGRALGCERVTFDGEIRPANKLISYDLSVKRVVRGESSLILADGSVAVDGRRIYRCESLRVGMFRLPYEWPVAGDGASRPAVAEEVARGPA